MKTIKMFEDDTWFRTPELDQYSELNRTKKIENRIMSAINDIVRQNPGIDKEELKAIIIDVIDSNL